MNKIREAYLARERIREEEFKKFFIHAKSKLDPDFLKFLLDDLNKDNFEWTTYGTTSNKVVSFRCNLGVAAFYQASDTWRFSLYENMTREVSEPEFFKYLKLKVFI